MDKCREDKVTEATIKIMNLKTTSQHVSRYFNLPEETEAFDIALDEMRRSISRNPKYELPVHPGTYLIKRTDGHYLDAEFRGEHFYIIYDGNRVGVPIKMDSIVAWWLLPRE